MMMSVTKYLYVASCMYLTSIHRFVYLYACDLAILSIRLQGVVIVNQDLLRDAVVAINTDGECLAAPLR